MIVKKNKQGAGRPPKIAGAKMWRGYLSAANIAFINRFGPGQASEQARLALDAAEASVDTNNFDLDVLLDYANQVAQLQATVARLERELQDAREK